MNNTIPSLGDKFNAIKAVTRNVKNKMAAIKYTMRKSEITEESESEKAPENKEQKPSEAKPSPKIKKVSPSQFKQRFKTADVKMSLRKPSSDEQSQNGKPSGTGEFPYKRNNVTQAKTLRPVEVPRKHRMINSTGRDRLNASVGRDGEKTLNTLKMLQSGTMPDEKFSI